jgi:ectoine hydroxylase-related dioxygenase (phytanoyl-CoA dioxygenase family)
MLSNASILVSDEQIKAFKQDGAVVLRGIFKDWVETLQTGVERNISTPTINARKHFISEGAGVYFTDSGNWSRIQEYHDFIFQSTAAKIAAELTGSQTIRLFLDKVTVKEPMHDITTPWHQDQSYFCVNGNQVCALWVALDPTSKDSGLELVAGSHCWGRWFQPIRVADNSILNDKNGFEPMPDIDAHRPDYDILSWDLEPGDAIAFHLLTIHGANFNQSRISRRRAFITFWLGDDTTFTQRSGITLPKFPGLKLKEGDPLDAEEFPVVWSSQGR